MQWQPDILSWFTAWISTSRTNPLYQKVKELLESGELGQMKRVIWIVKTRTVHRAIMTKEVGEQPGTRRRRCAAEPESTQSGSVAVDVWNAKTRKSKCLLWKAQKH